MPDQPQDVRRLAAIMFTDMVGFSALTEKNEKLAFALLEDHRRILRNLFPVHHGREINTVGDGFIVEFESALEATRCAIEVQKAIHEHNASTGTSEHIHLRIGLHLGDIVHHGNDVQGDGVNIAARIQPLAGAGGISLSEDVARQIQNKIEFPVLRLGKGELKNIRLPVEIYRIVLPWETGRGSLITKLSFKFRQHRVRQFSLVALLSLALIIAGVRLFKPTVPSRRIQSLAVLPLRTGEREDAAYISEGVTKELIDNLRRLPYLRVLPFSAVAPFNDQSADPLSAGRSLQVDAVLQGSLSKKDDALSLTMEMLDTRTGDHVWGARSDGKQSGILATLYVFCTGVAVALDIPPDTMMQKRLGKYLSANMGVYDAYLRGRYYAQKPGMDNVALSVEYFAQVLQQDSQYVPALTGLASVQELQYERGWSRNLQRLADAETNARKALRLDTTNADAYIALGAIESQRNHIADAVRLYTHALTLDPQNKIAMWQIASLHLFVLNDPVKAVTYLKQIEVSDPTNATVVSNLGVGFAQMKNYPEAISAFERAIALDTNHADSYGNVGYSYERIANYDSALHYYRLALRKDPRRSLHCQNLATLLLSRKEYARAESVLTAGTAMLQDDPDLLYLSGLMYSLWGKPDKALQKYQDGLLLVQRFLREQEDPAGNTSRAALFCARMGQDRQAITATAQALSYDSTNGEVLLKVARVYAILGSHDKMVQYFKRARRMNPEYDAAYVSTAPDFESYRNDPVLLTIAR